MVLAQDLGELPDNLRQDMQQYQRILSLDPYKTFGMSSHNLTGQLKNHRALEIDYDGISYLEKIITIDSILTHEEYEKKEFPLDKASGIEVIQYLMAEHGLKESDLPEIGNQSLVSDVLTGKHELNLTMIKALAKRFGVTEQTFLG